MKLSKFNVIIGDWGEFIKALYASGQTLPEKYKFCKWPENDFIATRFPTKQIEEAQEIVRWFNEGGYPFVVVTSSPYILKTFNNCLYAHYKGETHPEETEKELPKEFWLDASQVAAYKCGDGVVEDILEISELGPGISIQAIDTASEIISAQFCKLAKIQNP